ncbi:TetR/AcrR family transcriptional regulator [Streptomyces sp. NPDC057939]|uniref:TetR/AcrR family transcriptional regulator n=1 Tax=Streptomyces sp. NPDC057939 TaxID=3346284 RepID=UPI0036EB6241
MPLPRFHRLPAERQEHILAVARGHFAEHGPEAASYNRIIEATGVSKTAAYQYFDGREDLLAAVLDGVRERLLDALGPWVPAEDPEGFWAGLAAGSRALVSHLHANADDLALAGAVVARTPDGEWPRWFDAVVGDGQRLGVVRTDIDRDLLVSATAAVFQAVDAWALAALRSGAPDTGDGERQLRGLLRGLWSTPGDEVTGRAH